MGARDDGSDVEEQSTLISDGGENASIEAADVAASTRMRAEESAVENQLRDANDPQSRFAIDERRLPLVARIYGILLLVASLIELPLLVLGILFAVRQFEPSLNDVTLSFILSCVHAVVMVVNVLALGVFCMLLIRNRRRYAARWAYVLIPLNLTVILLDICLHGVDSGLLPSLVQLVLLVVISVTADPSLRDERRLRWALRRMEERERYEQAAKIDMVGRDLSGKGYISLDVFNLFWVWVVACVFGLVIETIYHAVVFGGYEDRAGLLYGPFSPIYGFGAVLLTVCLNRLWRKNPVLIFFASAVIGGAFEYFTSWFLQVAFGICAWDYSGEWLSIDGRTSGRFMIMWGVLGLVWIKLCLPRLLKLINRIPWKWRYSLTLVVFVLLFVDGVMTLMAFDCWYTRVAGLEPGSPIEQFFANHYGNEYMQQRFQTMSLDPSRAGRA